MFGNSPSPTTGRGVLNLRGTNTVLTTTAFDLAQSGPAGGLHEIYVTDGAQVYSHTIEFGIYGGTSNTMVVSGPGSTWNNDYFLWNSARGQSLVISNGGLFQTGGNKIYSDQACEFAGPDNKLIVMGSGSKFRSEHRFRFGVQVSDPNRDINNLILITNGGSFWAESFSSGASFGASYPTQSGGLISVEDGTFSTGLLDLLVGTLRVETGVATVTNLLMRGGPNAVIQCRGGLLIGFAGPLAPGELGIGNTNVVLPALNGDFVAGAFRIGATPGSSAQVTFAGARAFITNGAGLCRIGDYGNGSLKIVTGYLRAATIEVGRMSGAMGSLILDGPGAQAQANSLWVGGHSGEGHGNVNVLNGGLLQVNNISADPSNPVTVSGVLQFTTNAPVIENAAVLLQNGTLSFKNSDDAAIQLDEGPLTALNIVGPPTLRLIDSTNHPIAQLALGFGVPRSYQQIVFENGTAGLRQDSLLIGVAGRLFASNTVVTISGSVSNWGSIDLVNSTLIFEGPVSLGSGSTLKGVGSRVVFKNVLSLPTDDVQIGSGLRLNIKDLVSGGGHLLLNGGEIEGGSPGTLQPGIAVLSNGMVTYVNTIDAPLGLPPGLAIAGNVGLNLINSSNAFTENYKFEAAAGGYSSLLMAQGTNLWQSGRLTIGAGASVTLSNSSSKIELRDREFLIESGGRFESSTSASNYVGFSSSASNHFAAVNGTGSTWIANGPLFVGDSGSGNHLLITNGGMVSGASTFIGPGRGSAMNSISVIGPQSLLTQTGSLSIGGNGSNNTLLASSGATIRSRLGSIGGAGPSNQVILKDPTSKWLVTNQLIITGRQGSLLVSNGALVDAESISISSAEGGMRSDGTGSVINVGLSVSLSGFGNAVRVQNGGSLFSSNFAANGFQNCFVDVVGSDSLMSLKNTFLLVAPSFTSATNKLTIGNGAQFKAKRLEVRPGNGAVELINSGTITVTNDTTNGLILIAGGRVEQQDGLIVADQVVGTNGAVLRLRGGVLQTRSSEFGPTNLFYVGEGSARATLKLTGGTNIFRAGLRVAPLGELVGTGTILGDVTNNGILMLTGGAPFRLAGNLVLEDLSRLFASIGGPPDALNNGSLTVVGNLQLGGTLVIRDSNEFKPGAGDFYKIFEYGTVSGTFSNIYNGRVLTESRLGSFRVDSLSGGITLSDFRTEDVDGDGMQDTWALQHFGISPLPPGTAPNALMGDADGDGLTNLEEFKLQTNPLDSKSGLSLTLGFHPTGVPVLRFPYIQGRTYRVYHSNALGTWLSEGLPYLQPDALGQVEWVDNSAVRNSNRFYYIVVE
jgi:T5SS/PEP-CTERM-associated repeat protein